MNDNYGKYYILESENYNADYPLPNGVKLGELNHGDLYEVLRAVDGKLLFFFDHLERLNKSISLMNYNYKLDYSYVEKRLKELLIINNAQTCNIKIVVSNFDGIPKLFAYLSKFSYPSEDTFLKGVHVGLLKIERNNPNAKVINVNYKKAVADAIERGNYFEVLLENNNGIITEGSRTNVFVICKEKIYTAPVELVLEGITRKYVIKACENAGYTVVEKALNSKEVSESDGIFLSGTSIKTLPVSSIDDIKINTPDNNVFKEIYIGFNEIFYANLR